MPIVQQARRSRERHWDEQWSAADPARKRRATAGHPLAAIFTAHLPPAARVLEAGCGLGQWVAWLRARGFDAEGLDASARAVERGRAFDPSLPLFAGDLRRIPRPDGHYQGYVSLGVLEHFEEGPAPALAEARRVLAPGGVLIVTVPCINVAVRLRARLQGYDGDEFYQYIFTPREFAAALAQGGFEVTLARRWDVATGLKRHLLGGAVDTVAERARGERADAGAAPALAALRRLSETWPLPLLFGHMLVCVARRA